MIHQPPLFTLSESPWTMPRDFPDLSDALVIDTDLETNDKNLTRLGPGGARGKDGYIAGIYIGGTFADKTHVGNYYPVRHLNGPNFDEDMVMRYVKKQLTQNRQQRKRAYNAPYEMEWLEAYGIDMEDVGAYMWEDSCAAESLLDEEKDPIEGGYNLNDVAKLRINRRKDETLLKKAGLDYGIPENKIKEMLWMLPAKFVGPYACRDGTLMEPLWNTQLKLLEKEELMPVWKMEQKLLFIVHKMRMRGIRVDLEAAHKAYRTLLDELKKQQIIINSYSKGREVNYSAADDLLHCCEHSNIPYKRTDKGNPSFEKNWMAAQKHPFYEAVSQCRSLYRLAENFLMDIVIKQNVKGRIHAQFSSTRTEDGDGTRTGRFSASNPPLQQAPARNELASLIRKCFLPEEGEQWMKRDYSQQEPRLAVHYAFKQKFDRADEARQIYIDNPEADFYKDIVMKAIAVERWKAKKLYLALTYVMGVAKTAVELGCAEKEAQEVRQEFFRSLPWLKDLSNNVARVASERGFIRTFTGRKRRFDYWEPCNATGPFSPKKFDRAKCEWRDTPIKRWKTYKAMNSLMQGGGGDMNKLAMIADWEHERMIPHLTMHDELGNSISDVAQALRMKKLMETVYKFEVPMVADLKMGSSWGAAEENEKLK